MQDDERIKGVNIELPIAIHKAIKIEAARRGVPAREIYLEALQKHLNPTNRTNEPENLTKAEKRLIERLLYILRAKYAEPPKAVAANINLFFDHVKLKEESEPD